MIYLNLIFLSVALKLTIHPSQKENGALLTLPVPLFCLLKVVCVLHGLSPVRRRTGITSVYVVTRTHSPLFLLYLHALLLLAALEEVELLDLF